MVTTQRIRDRLSSLFGFGSRLFRHNRRHSRSRRKRSLIGIEALEARLMLSADAYEPNDTSAAAVDLGNLSQRIVDLSIHEASNEDWYRWTANQAGAFTVDVYFAHTSGDLELEVRDTNNNLLGRSDTSTSGKNFESVTLQPVQAGQELRIKVSGVNGATNDYTLTTYGTAAAGTNFAPVAVDDSTVAVKLSEWVSLQVTSNDSDADGDELQVLFTQGGEIGSRIEIGTKGTLNYIPPAGFVGTDMFTYTISDGRGGLAKATVTVDVGLTDAYEPNNTPANAADLGTRRGNHLARLASKPKRRTCHEHIRDGDDGLDGVRLADLGGQLLDAEGRTTG